MASEPPTREDRRQPLKLLGRRRECEALDRLTADALAGRSGVLVLRGEPGVGKSALLRYLSDRVSGWHLATAEGVESEMELAYSGLHQLCGSMLDHLDRLPLPQRDALATVFGLSAGPPPDRFLVGLATLTLLTEVAEQQPVGCIVDDAQWLDQASAQILGFVARRVLAERIAIACAARTGSGDGVLVGLPELSLQGLGDGDARALLLDNVYGPLDARVCDQIVTESHGNPLALLELPRTWNSPADFAGGFGLPGGQPVAGKIEQSYTQRLLELPSDTRLLVLTAAAEPLGDPVLLHDATETLGVDMAAAEPAARAGLLELAERVTLAHPLVRSAAYRSAATEDRRRVHRALAAATDAAADPDRRAWHRARAVAGPNEQAARELERSAGRAQARGGIAAAAAFLQRAAALTGDPARRAERALAAAEATLRAGGFDEALRLLASAETGRLDEFQRARVDVLRGEIALFSTFGSDAPPLLLKAAQRLEGLDLGLARDTYLDAWGAALLAGSSSTQGTLLEISLAARSVPRPEGPTRPSDLLLDSLAAAVTEGPAAAAPLLEEAVTTFADGEVPAQASLRWGWLSVVPTYMLWDEESTYAINARQMRAVRDAGALAPLALDLSTLALLALRCGELASAAGAIAEADALTTATGASYGVPNAMMLAVLQGREAEARALIDAARESAAALGQGVSIQLTHWMFAVLCNALGHYEDAAAVAHEVHIDSPDELVVSAWTAVEVLEAATRSHKSEVARTALARVEAATSFARSDSAQGILARSRALVSEGDTAERLYREAIDRLGRSRLRPELARAQLLYGEWLRRENRRVDAREQLRSAHDQLSAIGMEAFAARARRELVGTGEKARKRSDATRHQLTPQEEQIARLARDGLSNPEIGAQLFISARTVEWHLRNVFTKLDISSRRALRRALPEDSWLLTSA